MKRLYFVSEIEVAVQAARMAKEIGETSLNKETREAMAEIFVLSADIIRDGLAEIEAEHARGNEG